jgi:hypothetical protein
MPFNIRSSGSYYATFDDSGLSANRTYTLPNQSGALLTTSATASQAVTASYSVTASFALSSASGGGGGGDVPTFMVVKSADETVINSNTLQPDDEIVFAGTAEKRYYFECVVIYQRSNFGGGGDQPGIRITMGNELAIQGLMNVIPLHPSNTVWVFGGDSFPGRIDYSTSITQAIAIKMQGTYFPQAGQNAIMRLRWTQITPSATVGTMVLKGSKLLVWEL